MKPLFVLACDVEVAEGLDDRGLDGRCDALGRGGRVKGDTDGGRSRDPQLLLLQGCRRLKRAHAALEIVDGARHAGAGAGAGAVSADQGIGAQVRQKILRGPQRHSRGEREIRLFIQTDG